MATPAVAGDGPECDPTEQSCDIIIVEPGEEPVDPPTDDTGYTPGPAECLHNLGGGQYEKVPCTSDAFTILCLTLSPVRAAIAR